MSACADCPYTLPKGGPQRCALCPKAPPMTAPDTDRPWPLGAYAPGSYMCRCVRCDKQFEGDKRATNCLECAVIGVNARLEALLADNARLLGEVEKAKDEADDLRERLRDVVMIDAEEWALSGGGPGIGQRREAALARAREPFEP